MLRWMFCTSLIALAALSYVAASTRPAPPSQPIQFSHKVHLDYFRDGRHRREMVSMHEEMLKKDQLWDQETMDKVEKGGCTACHRNFDHNAPDLAKLGHCGECHRAFAVHLDDPDWPERKDERPCMGCHNSVLESASASIPNINTCAACHPRKQLPADMPPLPDGEQEQKLLEFITQEKTIPWPRVGRRLPSEIVFSHERHVELGRVKCHECHGQDEQAEQFVSAGATLRMDDCIFCHHVSGADNDCLACHR
jgi:hypothetical protein